MFFTVFINMDKNWMIKKIRKTLKNKLKRINLFFDLNINGHYPFLYFTRIDGVFLIKTSDKSEHKKITAQILLN